jgi:hypothetical protein
VNCVLLTGAGFTKPFGGYLASEMWAAILNQPEIQSCPSLLEGMRNFLNYEEFYGIIQDRGTGEEKKNLSAAIRNAFHEMDDSIRTSKPAGAASCCTFITRIAQDQDPTFIFTLNQDLFFERYYSGEKVTVFPGLPEHMRLYKQSDPEDSSTFMLRLPTAEQLNPLKAGLFRKGAAEIAYVKLHGSQGWLSHDGSDGMVVGTQKAAVIESEPLLRWYFSLFEQVINRPDTRLVVVGYGFRDEHINLCIASAMKDGLKLYVISPQLPQDFKNLFIMHDGFNYQVPQGEELWRGLAQYWPVALTEFYQPGGEPRNRGRALFRTLGLI